MDWESMALHSQSPSSHGSNQLAGQRIPHPASTNFEEFELPSAKRQKTVVQSEAPLPRREPEDLIIKNGRRKQEIADSEAESEEDSSKPTPPVTALESSLPPTKSDKEAIAEYEATRAAEAADLGDLHERLGQRTWIQGRSSIYVDAFNLALETVLEDEAHLFDETEARVFEDWRSLSYEAQYLYVRLFLRKTAAWHRISRLGYYGDIANLSDAIAELLATRPLPSSAEPVRSNPGELAPPQDTIFESSYTFADSSHLHITSLEEASSLLLLDELKAIAKDAKVQGKNKRELLDTLRRSSRRQSGLGWKGLKRSDTEESTKSEASAASDDSHGDISNATVNRDSYFVKRILANTGACIRLSAAPLKLFERVLLVFYRSTEWTETSLTTIILARISRRNFPDYIVSRSANIFSSRSALLEFEAALRTQFRVDGILEMNGTVTKDGLRQVQEIFEAIYPRWKVLIAEEQQKENRVYESGEGAYLRRFSPAWVYTRIVHKGLYPFARAKEHRKEHDLLMELLDQRLFHAARRGAWYQRKALLEEHYMWALESNEGRSDEAQKKYWKRRALQTCEDGLQDRECHLTYHYDLQKRITKLEKALNIAKRHQHDFGHVRLAKAIERTVEGIRIEKDSAASNGRGREGTPSRKGAKTIWLDEQEGGDECSVEAMCLSWYRQQGWKGYHSEGRIVRTLFGYLFYDILFTYVPNVFQTAYQTCPLDLFTDAFYPSRLSEINHRLTAISNGEAERLFRTVYEREHEQQTCVVGVDWTFELDDVVEIIRCFDGEALATICKLMAQEYQQRGGGIPDLFLWHSEKREVMFAEVKSENDHLSDTQRLWIHVLTGAGIRTELCNAVAIEVRND